MGLNSTNNIFFKDLTIFFTVAGFGLSLDDRQLLINNCNIVFHAGEAFYLLNEI